MSPRARAAAPWLLAAGAVVVGLLLVWGVQSGSCASGIATPCTTEPAVGPATAWVLTACGALFLAVAVRRAHRALRAQPRPRSGHTSSAASSAAR